MKRLVRALALSTCLLFAHTAHAQLPPDVKESYQAFQTAYEAGDMAMAGKLALKAWEQAEDTLGDHKTTGRLAQNYGNLYSRMEPDRTHAEALKRSMALSGFEGGTEAHLQYMERGLAYCRAQALLGKRRASDRMAETLVDYAEANGLTDSTFYGEALTLVAAAEVSRGQDEKGSEIAQKALTVFENATDGIITVSQLEAKLYSGYASENSENYLDAALKYQDVMNAVDGIEFGKYPLVDTALGRWIHMRSAIRVEGKLEEAEQAGLCQCWPYDKPRNESVKPVKRMPPKMPRIAQQSGFVVVELDLDDSGKPINVKTITAWPTYFEKPALEAVESWKYSPRSPDEADSDRQGLITTVNFRLSDRNGRMIW